MKPQVVIKDCSSIRITLVIRKLACKFIWILIATMTYIGVIVNNPFRILFSLHDVHAYSCLHGHRLIWYHLLLLLLYQLLLLQLNASFFINSLKTVLITTLCIWYACLHIYLLRMSFARKYAALIIVRLL